MKPELLFEKKTYNGHPHKTYQGHSYIEYTKKTKDGIEAFDNATCVIFDVTSDAYKQATHNTGGFYANMTWRNIERIEKQDACNIICMWLFCLPQKTNEFCFAFLYTDEDGNLRDYQLDNNAFDFKYFYGKLKEAIIIENRIFDHLDNPKLKTITDMIHPDPSTDFGIIIDGKPLSYSDVLCYPGIDILENANKERFANLKKNHADHIQLEVSENILNGMHIEATVYSKNNQPIKNYQAYYDCKTFKDYQKLIKETDHEDITEDSGDAMLDNYTIRISFLTLRRLADKLTRIQ